MSVIGELIGYILFIFIIPIFFIFNIIYSGYGIAILIVVPALTFLLNKHIGRKLTVYTISLLNIFSGIILGYHFIVSTIAEISPYSCKVGICTIKDAILFGVGMGIAATLIGFLGLFVGLTFLRKK